MGHDLYRRTLQQHFAPETAGGVNDGHAKENIHECGFACAVFSQKRMNFAGTDTERDVLQDGVAAVFLGNPVHFKNIF